MDVKSLYSNLKAEESAAIVKEFVANSKANFEGLDIDELGKTLRLNLSSKEIEDAGMDDYLPFKKKKKKPKKNKEVLNEYNDDIDDILMSKLLPK